MTTKIETVKIVNDDFEGGHVLINARDFDAAMHRKYEPKPEPATPEPKPSRK